MINLVVAANAGGAWSASPAALAASAAAISPWTHSQTTSLGRPRMVFWNG